MHGKEDAHRLHVIVYGAICFLVYYVCGLRVSLLLLYCYVAWVRNKSLSISYRGKVD